MFEYKKGKMRFEENLQNMKIYNCHNISTEVKIKIKEKVFAQISETQNSFENDFNESGSYINVFNLFSNAKLEKLIYARKKSIIKYRVLEKIENSGYFVNIFDFLFKKRTWVKMSIAAILLSMISPFSIDDFTIYAAKQNFLKIETGVVKLYRNNQEVNINDNLFVIEEGDKIITGEDGRAELRFAINGIGRLDSSTSVQVNQLSDFNQENDMGKVVNIAIEKGRIWGKTMNTPKTSAKLIVTPQDSLYISAKDKSTFDINVKQNEIEIKALENIVDVHISPSEEKFLKKTVLEGYKVELQNTEDNDESNINKSSMIGSDHSKVVKVTIMEIVDDDPWVSMNREKDKLLALEMRENLGMEIKNKAGILPDEALYSVKKLGDQAKLSLTFDEKAKEIYEIEIILREINELFAISFDSEKDISEPLNLNIKKLEEKMEKIKEEKIYKEFIASTKIEIAAIKSTLADILPSQKYYQVKYDLDKIAFDLEIDPLEKIKLELDSSLEELMVIKNLSTELSDSQIEGLITSYENNLLQISKDTESLNKDDRESISKLFLEYQLSNLETLKIIENKVKNVDTAKKIHLVSEDIIEKFIKNVDEISDTIKESKEDAVKEENIMREKSNNEKNVVPEKGIDPIENPFDNGSNNLEKIIPEADNQNFDEFKVEIVKADDSQKLSNSTEKKQNERKADKVKKLMDKKEDLPLEVIEKVEEVESLYREEKVVEVHIDKQNLIKLDNRKKIPDLIKLTPAT